MTYEAFVLTHGAREELLKAFPPKYPEVIAHHVTHRFGVPKDPNGAYGSMYTNVRVVGYAEEDGLEAVVIAINGSMDRPDGKTYHITLSLDREKGKKPQMSNQLIDKGFKQINGQSLVTTFEYI